MKYDMAKRKVKLNGIQSEKKWFPSILSSAAAAPKSHSLIDSPRSYDGWVGYNVGSKKTTFSSTESLIVYSIWLK